MPQDSAKGFIADDLFALGERVIIIGPLPSERFILQSLVWSEFIVISDVRSNEMVEMLPAKDDEEFKHSY